MQNRRNRHLVLWIALGLLVLLIVVLGGASWYMLDYALCPSFNKGRHEAYIWKRVQRNYPSLRSWIDSLRTNHCLHDTAIVNARGDSLHGVYLFAPRRSNKVAVVVHGYTDCAIYMLPWAKVYQEMNYNVLLPELYGNGRSAGDHQQMGWLDCLDVLRWISLANHCFGLSDRQSRMVVHGISMGAATTMCVSGEQTPKYVRAFVEDCGYTSAWDEFGSELRDQFGLPSFPLLYTASALCRLRYGWSFGGASPLKMVVRCHKPMLFIHGTKDDFVPTWMVEPLYKAKPQPKEKWLGPGSAHARSLHDHPQAYRRVVKQFVERYVEP